MFFSLGYNTPRPAAMSCTILVVLESVTHESLYQCLPDLRRRVNSQKISIKIKFRRICSDKAG